MLKMITRDNLDVLRVTTPASKFSSRFLLAAITSPPGRNSNTTTAKRKRDPCVRWPVCIKSCQYGFPELCPRGYQCRGKCCCTGGEFSLYV
uniref:Uncharacterized protein n=1 Tax=Romanomermis culicivorax TaxID=13658 RepID=A0A915IQT2_ROMCU